MTRYTTTSFFSIKTEYARNLRVYAEKEDDIFAFYDEMRSNRHHINPPENLYPFFFYDVKMPCVITEYFRIKFDFFAGTATSFFSLFNNVEFRRYVCYFFLEKYRDNIDIEAVIKGNIIEVGKALVAMRHHGDRAETFVQLFYNFEQLLDELVNYLKKLHQKMNLFHAKKRGLYQEAIEKFCSSDNINILKKTYDIKSGIKLTNQIFSVCFMQQYIFLHRHKNNQEDYSFIVGCNSNIAVHKFLDYRHVTYITASKIFANDIANDIVTALEKEELTITKLAIKLKASRTTMDRVIGILYDDFAIQITRTNGNEKYYKLNPEYFLVAKAVLGQRIDNILTNLQNDVGGDE